jgi:hypothetical protein
VLPFGRLCYGEPNAIENAVGYAQFYSRAESAVIRVYDAAGNATETHVCNPITAEGASSLAAVRGSSVVRKFRGGALASFRSMSQINTGVSGERTG